jgi:N-glycosylase/DNA lyase
LLIIPGVGEKVANCVILFGLQMMQAFPVDVWMKRALEENFPKGFDPSELGPNAGLAQQYMYYYARCGCKT